MPAISVLLPVRNARPWLSRALDSLWNQTFRDFEVIAIDDGSTDGSLDVLSEYSSHEPRLRVERSPGHGLPAAQRRVDAGLGASEEGSVRVAEARLFASFDAARRPGCLPSPWQAPRPSNARQTAAASLIVRVASMMLR